jgi:Raf kinase inhibitor-like YbhB/YbcL family protein
MARGALYHIFDGMPRSAIAADWRPSWRRCGIVCGSPRNGDLVLPPIPGSRSFGKNSRNQSFRSPVLPDEMATHPLYTRRASQLAAILLGTVLLSFSGSVAMAMTLNSTAFKQNGHIPSKYTCEGDNISPPLAWDGVPEGAKSLVLIIDDPDAPDPKAPQRVWVHWVVYNIPPETKSLPEDAGKTGFPQGTAVGVSDFKKAEYGGPCPPIGRHRYFHKLYALDVTLDLKGATKSQVERAMQGHVLANAELIGTYQKGDR